MAPLTLVTGAGGFIGGQLVRDLLGQGVPVRAVDKKPVEEWYFQSSNAENLVVDLQLADHHHLRAAGTGQPGQKLTHAPRCARGQHPGDGAEARAPPVQAPPGTPPAHAHDGYSVPSRRRFGRPGKIYRQSAGSRCYEYEM